MASQLELERLTQALTRADRTELTGYAWRHLPAHVAETGGSVEIHGIRFTSEEIRSALDAAARQLGIDIEKLP
jgi:hypothetical protein